MYPTLVFALIFALPMLGFYFYIAQRDRNKYKKYGFLALGLMFIAAVVVAYFVNNGK